MISKKGSLNLSIQAIVILVMAMAVLGLGLGFIRTLMGQSQGQFEEAIGAVELVNPPSSAEPFVVDVNIKVKSSGIGAFQAGVYNDGTFSNNNLVTLRQNIVCQPAIGSTMTIRTVTQHVNDGEYAGFKSIINGNDVPVNKYICQMEAYSTALGSGSLFKQVEITVTS